MRAVLAHRLFGGGDAGAVDQAHQLAHGRRLLDRGLAIGFAGDVAPDEGAADLARHGLAALGVHVGDDHLAAAGRQQARRAFTQARGASGDDEYLVLDLHGVLLCR
ncbi:hypothetical protein MASR1M50_12570 [Burkholderiales bacterium]